jgi:hypothetical protein
MIVITGMERATIRNCPKTLQKKLDKETNNMPGLSDLLTHI